MEQEQEDRSEQLRELLQRLDEAGVDPSLADFLETDEIAQVVVEQLLTTIDGLQEELEKAKRAQRDAETRLIRATHKCPASPSLEETGDALRPKRQRNAGDGGASQAPPPEALAPPKETRPRSQRVPEPSGTVPEPSIDAAQVREAAKEEGEVQEPPTEPKTGKRKPRRGEGQTPVPTSYDLPGSLPRAPEPPIDTSPDDIFLSETIEDTVDDDRWREELWEAIEGESAEQISQRKAHNRKVTTAHDKKVKSRGKNQEEFLRSRRRHNRSRPGRVPDGMGVVTVGQYLERDNAFHGLLTRHFYHSPYSNRVYAGRTALAAQRAEARNDEVHLPDPSRRLYKVANRGLPMNPQEIDDLVALVNHHHGAPIDKAEGYLLLRELRRISALSVAGRRDRAMALILGDEYNAPAFVAPYPSGHPIWDHEPLTPESSDTPPSCRTSPGIPIPDAGQPFALAAWARYILYHGRPGTPNQFVGIAMDHALRVNYRSVFGFQLGRVLSPSNPSARASFLRHYVRVVAIPGRYADYLAETMDQYTDGPLVSPPDTVTLTRLDVGDRRATDITIDDVLTTLASNHVPLTWVEHAYTYGLHYLDHHYTGPSQTDTIYREIDDERIRWLGVHGVPPAIAEWDGWYTPTVEDVRQVNTLRAAEEEKDLFCQEDGRDWLLAGEDPHFDQLHARRGDNDPTVTWLQHDDEATDLPAMEQEEPLVNQQVG